MINELKLNKNPRWVNYEEIVNYTKLSNNGNKPNKMKMKKLNILI